MSHVFISYSTRNSDYARKLADKLRAEGFDVWIDNSQLRNSEDWWRSIVLALRDSGAVVVILTPESDGSEWVQREITLADKYKKPIFPLWLDGTLDTPNWEYFVRIQVEDVRGGKLPPSHVYDTLALHAPRKEQRGVNVTKQPAIAQPDVTDKEFERDIANPPQTTPTLPRSPQIRSRPNARILAGAAVVLIVGFMIVLAVANQPPSTPGTSTPTTLESETLPDNVSGKPTVAITEPKSGDEFVLGSQIFITAQASDTVGVTRVVLLANNQTVKTVSSQSPAGQKTFEVILDYTPRAQGTVDFQLMAYRGSIASDPANVSINIRATADAPITANSQWTPVTQTFDGIDMVLVPEGCFDMGSITGYDAEQPVGQVCFDTPFWLDRTEVTNAQYVSSGTFSGDNLPRETVNWSDAKAFCERRGARLPTEAEWEYAARGPNDWIYPWGNDFVADNVVYEGNSSNQTAPVGSKPGGVSWVGALDMSGNVLEWVSTIYDQAHFPYLYQPDDGREDTTRTDVPRGVRGGSWYSNEVLLRATTRTANDPTYEDHFVGFRCARDY
jgi:hypothetical protein